MTFLLILVTVLVTARRDSESFLLNLVRERVENNTVTLVICNHAWLELLEHAILQFDEVGIDNYIIGTHDHVLMSECEDRYWPCFHMKHNEVVAKFNLTSNEHPNNPHMLSLKVIMLNYIIELGFSCHVMDLDISLISNPYQWYATHGAMINDVDMIITQGIQLNTGFYLIYATDASTLFVKAWLKNTLSNMKTTEQIHLNRMIQQNKKYVNASRRQYHFNATDGTARQLLVKVVGAPYFVTCWPKYNDRAVMYHANCCCGTVQKKIDYLKNYSLW